MVSVSAIDSATRYDVVANDPKVRRLRRELALVRSFDTLKTNGLGRSSAEICGPP